MEDHFCRTLLAAILTAVGRIQNKVGLYYLAHRSFPNRRSADLPDSLFNEVPTHPHLNTTPSTSFDIASDDLLNTYLTTQRSTPVPPHRTCPLTADKHRFLDI